jgi:hypothetical protein
MNRMILAALGAIATACANDVSSLGTTRKESGMYTPGAGGHGGNAYGALDMGVAGYSPYEYDGPNCASFGFTDEAECTAYGVCQWRCAVDTDCPTADGSAKAPVCHRTEHENFCTLPCETSSGCPAGMACIDLEQRGLFTEWMLGSVCMWVTPLTDHWSTPRPQCGP